MDDRPAAKHRDPAPKVIIIGAGIGGLAAAIALHQAGYGVAVYDRVQQLRPVGAGISLWSNGVKVLNQLGLGAAIAAIGGNMQQMEYRWRDGRLLNHIPIAPLTEAVGQAPYPVARANLQAMLVDAYEQQTGQRVQLGHDCVAIGQSPQQVTATFADGPTVTGDLLVVANGVRSNLREFVLGRVVEPRYVGYVNWNGLVPSRASIAPPDTWVIYVGDHQRASVMPVGNDRCYFFFDVPLALSNAFSNASPETFRAELSNYFQGWAEPVQELIQTFDPAGIARIPIHDMGPIERLVNGRIALLGDAAHTACPDLGQGGCQALEDAWVLADCLAADRDVVAALECYEQRRLDRVNGLVDKARQRAEMIHGTDPAVTQHWYQQLATEAPSDVTDAIAKTILAGALG